MSRQVFSRGFIECLVALVFLVDPIIAQVATEQVGTDDSNVSQAAGLVEAIRRSDAEQTLKLLTQGSDPNISDAHGVVPLHVAAEVGDLRICLSYY